MKKKLIAATAAATLLMGFGGPAHANAQSLHPDVEYAMSAVPGGTIVDSHKVEWPDLAMTLTVPNSLARAVGSCATGQYCAYSAPGGVGTRLTFGTCTVVSTAALSAVGSIANARSSGTVQARNAGGTVLATATAGNRVNVAGAVSTLRCAL